MALLSETIIGLLVHLAAAIICSGLWYGIIKHVCCTDVSYQLRGVKALHWCTIAVIIFYSLRAFFAMIFFMLITVKGEEHSIIVIEVLDLSFMFYAIALWLMVLLFLFRINFSFTGNYVSYSKPIIIALYIGFAIVCIDGVFIAILIFTDSWAVTGIWPLYWSVLFYISYTIALMYLLFRKVFTLLRARFYQLQSR